MENPSLASRLWLVLLVLAAAQPAACTDFGGFSVGTEDMGVDSDVEPDLGHDDASMDAEMDADTGTPDAGGDPDMGNGDQGTPNDQGMVDADPGCVSDAECPGEYRCDPDTDTCHASCSVATELIACKPSGHCSAASACVPDLLSAAANACARDSMCVGNVGCVDGFCCNATTCTGCRACNVAGNLGACTNVPAGTDPHDLCAPSGCTRDGSCDGAGACRAVAAGTDPAAVCTPQGCSNDGTCNGMGGCRVVAAGTDPNNACSGSTASCNTGLCSGSGGCAANADGTSCGPGQCGLSRCSGGGCTEACVFGGEASCEYCAGDDAFVCGGC